MNFGESQILKIDVNAPEYLYKLIVEDLCGERYHREFDERTRAQIGGFINTVQGDALNYEQFNELLLLCDQDRVSRPFFEFFFDPACCVKFGALPECVVRFRGFAMLCFGDFRFAYKTLSHLGQDELKSKLGSYSEPTDAVTKAFSERPSPALKIERISKEDTWCLGFIPKAAFEAEAKAISEAVRKNPLDSNLLKQAEIYESLGERIRQTETKGLGNTDVYLSWDYMDVYIATSMRRRWEFEETAEFVTSLFGMERIRELKLRYFDPTQSQCCYRIDKGLVEALMLKRALCTVYMVQESDTMGKDSELASTLAQGKPVIAYVPRVKEIEEHAERLSKYPLDFFKLRFQVLQAEGVLEKPELTAKLEKLESNFYDVINTFLELYASHRKQQPFSLWSEKEIEFKVSTPTFKLICQILATAEQFNFESRARTLRQIHPLSLQVNLQSGVANGVLVVRSADECADVLRGLLTNSLDFSIDFDQNEGCMVLKERISQSPFRAVTKYEKLANSFWNFYLLQVSHYLRGDH